MSLFNRKQNVIVGLFEFMLHNVVVSSFPKEIEKQMLWILISISDFYFIILKKFVRKYVFVMVWQGNRAIA